MYISYLLRCVNLHLWGINCRLTEYLITFLCFFLFVSISSVLVPRIPTRTPRLFSTSTVINYILDDTHFFSIKKVTRITKNRYWNYFQFVHQFFHFLMFAWQVALSNDLHLLLFHRGKSVYVVTIKLYSTIVFLSHTLKRKTPHLLGWK